MHATKYGTTLIEPVSQEIAEMNMICCGLEYLQLVGSVI